MVNGEKRLSRPLPALNIPVGKEGLDVEEEMRQSRARLDRGEAVSKTGNWELHLDTGIMFASNGARAIYNLKGPQWKLAEVQKIPLPEYRPLLDTALRRLIENNEPYNIEFKIKQVDTGTILDIHSIAEYDTDKRILFGVIQDITERKKIEASLYEAKELFFSIFNLCPLPILLSSMATGKYLDANKTFYEVLEYLPQDVIGHTSAEIGVFMNYADRETLVSTVQNQGIIIGLECPLYTKSRKIKSCLVSIATVERGGEECLLTCFIDISDRKRMEEELQRSQKLESLGILAGGIAHDFNNLLSGIFAYVDLGRAKSKDEELTRYLSKALSTIDRARGLTQQLLTFARGGDPLRKTDHLFPFVQETAQFALSGSNVSCHFEIPKDIWPCNYDRNQIGQVVDNIIINAQQAMPVGGNIELTARNVSFSEKEHPSLAKGNYVKISIRDTGIGIQKDFLSRIFDPFFTTKPKGHGLGLATCYSIMKRHNGSIDVESVVGKGSTFHLYVPAATDTVVSVSKEKIMLHSGTGTFLLMDDEKVIREAVGEMLKSFGYTVVCKENGEEAIDFLKEEIKAKRKISAMMFDLTIPGGMGGKEAIMEIRKLDKDIQVFVSSGYAQDSVIAYPKNYGFTSSIRKPFTADELAEMLEKHLKEKK
jgi:signal transduction histidine kinase/CheY-like chemotaxis protein